MINRPKPYVKYTLWFIALFSVYFLANTRSYNKNWQNIVLTDALGYYTYLPSILIYGEVDPTYTIDKTVNPAAYDYGFKHAYKDMGTGKVNKYSAGVALLCVPFFLAAHVVALLHPGYVANGYDTPYMVSIALAAIFYTIMGLWLMARILRLFRVGELLSALVLLTIFFGTNMMIYAVVEPGMSHVYSFFATAGFVYAFIKWVRQHQLKYLAAAALFMGLTLLVRPVNVLIILAVPFLCGDFATLKTAVTRLFQKPKHLLLAIGLCFSVIFIQMLIYLLQCGKLWVYAYGPEPFLFDDPHVYDMLFSYKKGVFLYTPVLLVSVLSTFYILRKDVYRLATFHFFFWVVIYVLASWWCWWYGGGFSIRPIIDFLPLMMLPLALTMQQLPRIHKSIYIGLLVVLVALCQWQSYQYRTGVLHWSDTTKEDYYKNFWKLKW